MCNQVTFPTAIFHSSVCSTFKSILRDATKVYEPAPPRLRGTHYHALRATQDVLRAGALSAGTAINTQTPDRTHSLLTLSAPLAG